jgi:hypothetical protein
MSEEERLALRKKRKREANINYKKKKFEGMNEEQKKELIAHR